MPPEGTPPFPPAGIGSADLERQEQRFADAYGAGDIYRSRDLYHPEVVYLSPTVRLFDWPRRIEGIDRTLEFIQLTIGGCGNTVYRTEEQALIDGGRSAFVRIHFDYDHSTGPRLRSNYVVLYRYRDGWIAQQEIYYDPSGVLDELRVPAEP